MREISTWREIVVTHNSKKLLKAVLVMKLMQYLCLAIQDGGNVALGPIALRDIDEVKSKSYYTITYFYTTSVCLTLSKPRNICTANDHKQQSQQTNLKSVTSLCVEVRESDSSLHLLTSVKQNNVQVSRQSYCAYLHSFRMQLPHFYIYHL